MNIPIMLSIVALAAFGIAAFFTKLAGANQVYSPSYLIVSSIVSALLGVVIHLVQRHSFELSPKMYGLASLGGIFATIGFYAFLLAFRLGGHGSIIFPIAGLSVIVSVPLSLIIFHEPLTATKLLGFGLGVSSIIFLSR